MQNELTVGFSSYHTFSTVLILHALTYIASVRITGAGAYPTIVLDVLEGIVHEPTVAASIAILPGAVDQLLFTEAHKVPCLLEVLPLKSACCTESPTGPTLTLIFHLHGTRVYIVLYNN